MASDINLSPALSDIDGQLRDHFRALSYNSLMDCGELTSSEARESKQEAVLEGLSSS